MHERDENCVQSFGWKTLREDIGIDERIILKLILENSSWRVWTGFIWVRISTSGGLF
jgi:hypothetical protein